jgi:hypothetical protein
MRPYRLVVVDLPVHGQRLLAAFAEKRLCPGVDVDNGQALMRKHGVGGGVNAAPVGPAVPQQARLTQGHLAHNFEVLAQVQDAEHRTHN